MNRQHLIRPAFCAVIFLLTAVPCDALTDAQLNAVRDGCEARRTELLTYASELDSRHYYDMASLWLNVNLDAVNTRIIADCDALINDPCFSEWSYPSSQLGRIYCLFNQNSPFFPGRLTPTAEQKILAAYWAWAGTYAKIADANPAKTWYFYGTENHDISHNGSAWFAAHLLKDKAPYNTYSYSDGSTVAQQHDAWTLFFKEFIRERARKGLVVECASPTYCSTIVNFWLNMYDFSDDSDLRLLASQLLDLWWADWAHDQIDGVRGGGKSRTYPGHYAETANGRDYWMCWYYFNFGVMSSDPSAYISATSFYLPPLVIYDLALDRVGKGVYEYKSRRPGMDRIPYPPDGTGYVIDHDFTSLYRYTYYTPDFVLGTFMVPKLSYDDWASISSQNRWHGAIFYGNPNFRVFPRCVGNGGANPYPDGSNYNQHWSVQNKGTLIAQKLLTNVYSSNTLQTRIFLTASELLPREEDGGWIFVQPYSSYCAVRPAWGGYTWDPVVGDDDSWLTLNDQYAPIIMEVARASDYMDMFILFKTAVLSQTIDVTSDVLTYTGLGDAGTFTFYTNIADTRPPEINGVPVDFTPPYTFDSPFMHQDYASGLVTIAKDARELILDFNIGYDDPPCGLWSHHSADINHDCFINADDLALLAGQFLSPIPVTSYLESAGLVVIEAENYLSKTPGAGPLAGQQWTDLTGNGSTGDGYVQALADLGHSVVYPDIENTAPRLSYHVYFTRSGNYYLWLKGLAVTGGEAVHYGIDGVAFSMDVNSAAWIPHGSFDWRGRRVDSERTTIEVRAPGWRTLDIWMCQDGASLDRLLLTQNEFYTPTSPTESTRQNSARPTDLDGDGFVTLTDFALLGDAWHDCSDPTDPINCLDAR